MPKVKLTVLKVMDQKDIFSESPVKQSKPLPPCEIHKEGQEFIVGPLMFGGNYPWQEEPGISVTCCTDGLRPVIFKVERIEG
jgi:hypothetical protein